MCAALSSKDAANLFFQLVSSRYEHASLILTSNLVFARWGDVFGDQIVAAAMIDRIVHHADVITLKGSSYRLKNTGITTLPSARTETRHNRHNTWPTFRPSQPAFFSTSADTQASGNSRRQGGDHKFGWRRELDRARLVSRQRTAWAEDIARAEWEREVLADVGLSGLDA